MSSTVLTTPDLVLLSLLSERPMHGYEVHLELERREVRDWAGISRPQIYYSIDKLARLNLIGQVETTDSSDGPERRIYKTSEEGAGLLASALEREDWTNQRERPAFLTWLALSWQAKPGVVEKQIARRQEFLRAELARERAVLRSIRKEVGHSFHEAVWMVTLVIQQFRVELRWLDNLSGEVQHWAPARHPRKQEAKTRI